jgi:hypothetical protein
MPPPAALMLLVLLAGPGALPAQAAPAARALVVQVREGAPADHPAFHHGADGSFTVSTRGEGDRDDRPAAPAGANGVLLATGTAPGTLHLREGERARVDLPGLQSLQFHLAPQRPAAATGAAAPSAAANPEVAGVVSFPAVSAFAVRFFLAGDRVRIELSPLGSGGVQAPWLGAGPPPGPLRLEGAVGQWIALGEAQGPPARSLQPTADAGPAQVWVRVYPAEPAAPADRPMPR